jgi:hypothetical protein
MVPFATTADVALLEGWVEGDLLAGTALALTGRTAATAIDAPPIVHLRAAARTTDSALQPLPDLQAATAAAVAQAVGEALASRFRALPITPERVLTAVSEGDAEVRRA